MSKDICFVEITYENLHYITVPADLFRSFELLGGEKGRSKARAFELVPEADA